MSTPTTPRKGPGADGTHRKPGVSKRQLNAIVKSILGGARPEPAARAAGVPTRTHEDWLRKGRQPEAEEPYRSYALAVELALDEWEISRITTIQDASGNDPRNAQWLLERRYPNVYGQRTRVEGTIAVQAVPMIVWEQLSVDEAETLVALLRKGAPAADDPALSASARPALELVAGPGDVVELTDEPAPG